MSSARNSPTSTEENMDDFSEYQNEDQNDYITLTEIDFTIIKKTRRRCMIYPSDKFRTTWDFLTTL